MILSLMIALVELPKIPPPYMDLFDGALTLRVAPLERVKPFIIALFVIHTQRIAPGPLVELGIKGSLESWLHWLR